MSPGRRATYLALPASWAPRRAPPGPRLHPLTGYERLEFERAGAEIKAGLDGETFAQLSSEGEAMSVDAAVAYALDA